MQVNEEEFGRKLEELSDDTMRKILDLAYFKNNLRKIYKTVMESKTEAEILKALETMEKD